MFPVPGVMFMLVLQRLLGRKAICKHKSPCKVGGEEKMMGNNQQGWRASGREWARFRTISY